MTKIVATVLTLSDTRGEGGVGPPISYTKIKLFLIGLAG